MDTTGVEQICILKKSSTLQPADNKSTKKLHICSRFLPSPSLKDDSDLSLLAPPLPFDGASLCTRGDIELNLPLVEAGKECRLMKPFSISS